MALIRLCVVRASFPAARAEARATGSRRLDRAEADGLIARAQEIIAALGAC